MARRRIGELLLAKGALTRAQLDAGLARQSTTRQRLGQTLIEQQAITEAQLAAALAESLSLKVVDLRQAPIDWTAVHMVRVRVCELYDLFPFAVEKGGAMKRLHVAMSDPLNLAARDEIEFTTGYRVVPAVATYSQVREAVLHYYYKVPPGDAVDPGKMTLVERGGSTRVVDEDEEPVVEGEEVISASTAIPSFERLVAEKLAETRARGGAGQPLPPDVAKLLRGKGDDAAVDRLERKFWALLRIMVKKGLITREDLSSELDAAGGED